MQKAIFIDLDGTLLKKSENEYYFHQEDIRNLKLAQKTMLIGVATGRAIIEVEYLENKEGINFDFIIGFNGMETRGLVINQDELILPEKVTKFLLDNNINVELQDGESRYFTDDFGMKIPYLLGTEIYKVKPKIKVKKIVIRQSNNSLSMQEIFNKLKNQEFPLEIIYLEGKAIEIIYHGIGKEKHLTDKLFINKKTVAVGDSSNDINLLKAVDKGYLMQSADAELKEKHNFILVETVSTVINKEIN